VPDDEIVEPPPRFGHLDAFRTRHALNAPRARFGCTILAKPAGRPPRHSRSALLNARRSQPGSIDTLITRAVRDLRVSPKCRLGSPRCRRRSRLRRRSVPTITEDGVGRATVVPVRAVVNGRQWLRAVGRMRA
jgi:hypothetical protein